MKKNVRSILVILAAMVLTFSIGITALAAKVNAEAAGTNKAFYTQTAAATAQKVQTESDAVKIALKDAGLKKAEVKRLRSEFDREENSYEIKFISKSDKTNYEYDIDADNGKIIEKSVKYAYKHTASREKIGKKAARKKVKEFSGFSLKTIKSGSCKYEYDDREGKYEVKFRKGSYKYEYDVLAPTGQIISFEKELIRR